MPPAGRDPDGAGRQARPSSASDVGRPVVCCRRAARREVKVGGMCCTTTMEGGSESVTTLHSAGTPPVEAPMQTMCPGRWPAGRAPPGRPGRRRGRTGVAGAPGDAARAVARPRASGPAGVSAMKRSISSGRASGFWMQSMAPCEAPQASGRGGVGVAGDDQHRHRANAHQLLEEIDAVHAREARC